MCQSFSQVDQSLTFGFTLELKIQARSNKEEWNAVRKRILFQ